MILWIEGHTMSLCLRTVIMVKLLDIKNLEPDMNLAVRIVPII